MYGLVAGELGVVYNIIADLDVTLIVGETSVQKLDVHLDDSERNRVICLNKKHSFPLNKNQWNENGLVLVCESDCMVNPFLK